MSLIEVKNLTKTYRMGQVSVEALRGVDLAVEEGEFVAIMGASGSGKSTLLHLLGLLDKPSGGLYKLASYDVSTLTDAEAAALRNKYLGFVFQQFNLLSKVSAKDNVFLPSVYSDGGKRTLDEAASLLQKVGLGERMNHKPNELSGGQQQRVAIARALMNNPFLILADEPTGNLDTRSAAEIIDILKTLNDSGITIVMVTHEPALAAAAKRIVKLQDGKIISDELLAAPAPAQHKAPISRRCLKQHSLLNSNRTKDYFFQALRSLVSNKTRSILSILGVLIGVASLISMMALGGGAQEAVRKQIESMGANLLIVRASSPRLGGISLETGTTIKFDLDDVYGIKNLPGVERVAPYTSSRGQIIYRGKNWNTRVEGTTADYPYVRNSVPTSGRYFDEKETITRSKVVVLGQTVVRELFGEQNPIGEFIKIKRIDFQVIGVLPAKGSTGWRDEDDKVMIPINTAMYRLLGREQIDYIDVKVAESGLMDDVGERIKKLVVLRHRLPPSRADLIDIRNMSDIQQTITATAKTFAYLLGSIAFVSLLVGGIGIMNIMLVSVTERTKEIGLRKAIGANNRDILLQFIIEAVVICLLGGALGILLGIGVSLLFSTLAGWSTIITVPSIFFAFAFSVMTGLFFGIWPAKKASRLNPIEALRYE